MSRKSSAYQSYLQNWMDNHPNIVEPTRVMDVDIRETILNTMTRGQRLNQMSRYLSGAEVWQMPEGRVVEFTNGFGAFDRVAIFENIKDYFRWDRPMSMNEYWNG